MPAFTINMPKATKYVYYEYRLLEIMPLSYFSLKQKWDFLLVQKRVLESEEKIQQTLMLDFIKQ